MTKRKHVQHATQREKQGFLSSLSPTTQDLLCVAFLYAVILVLFRGIVLERMAFSSEGDTAAALSYAHAGKNLMAEEGVDAIWMPYFFSGMPTFGNVAFTPHDVSYAQSIGLKILNLLFLSGPWTWAVVFYFLNGVFMFLLMRLWNFSRPAALLAAITVMLSPYTIGLASEGHGSKLMALSYLPLTFLLTHLLFERRNFLTFGLLSAAIGTVMLTNHMQITYYVFIVIGLYTVYHLIVDMKDRKLQALSKAALFVGALAVGMLIGSYIYLSVYEYAQFSIRGGGTAGSSGGLTYDYATNWSWNPWELLTLLVPGFFGFQTPYYWGSMPWTNSTVYIGIIPIVLALFALVYNRTRITIFFAVVTAIVFLMSFGKHFSPVYSLLFNYLPFFNKFRAPAMILHLLPFTVGFLAAFGFRALTETLNKENGIDTAKLLRLLTYVAGGLLAVFVLGLLLKSSVYDSLAGFMFEKEDQAEQLRQQYGQQAPQALAQLKQLRFEILWKDLVKFIIITVASLGVVILYLRKQIGMGILGAALIAMLTIDLVILDVKFVNPKPAASVEQSFRPDATIAFLKQQPGLFRIFPLGQQLFMDNTFAYHGVQSIGGYSPAKLKIYQTLLDSCLYHGTDASFPLNMAIVNMLNVRYLVAQGRLPEDRFPLVSADQPKRMLTYSNPGGLPRAFFVNTYTVCQSDHEVFESLNSPGFNPLQTAILNKPLPQTISQVDTPQALVTEFKSRRISIRTTATAAGLLVLSEVYYPAGWTARIDGSETEIFRTNYVLRSVLVPAGTHEIVFSFEPSTYSIGWTLTNAAWVVTGLCIVLGLWSLPLVRDRFRKRQTVQTSHTG